MRAIRPILAQAQETINRKLLGILPREVEQSREKTSWVVIALVVVIFAMTFRRVLRTFSLSLRERVGVRGYPYSKASCESEPPSP